MLSFRTIFLLTNILSAILIAVYEYLFVICKLFVVYPTFKSIEIDIFDATMCDWCDVWQSSLCHNWQGIRFSTMYEQNACFCMKNIPKFCNDEVNTESYFQWSTHTKRDAMRKPNMYVVRHLNFILYFHSYLLAPILNNDKYCIVKSTNALILPDMNGWNYILYDNL
jgi:hypothetical protein